MEDLDIVNEATLRIKISIFKANIVILENSNIPDDVYCFLTDDEHPVNQTSYLKYIIRQIVDIADMILITHDGKVNYELLRELRKDNIKIGPGEKDSFGWLTGVIYTKKGKIVYG
jgi:hypothetical protein